MEGVCVALLLRFQEKSHIVIQRVMRSVQPHDLFKEHVRRDTRSQLGEIAL